MYTVCGFLIDQETRCKHWHSEKDIIALKFKCCPDKYYPCLSCHKEKNDAAHIVLKYHLEKEKDEKLILCGKCKKELTFQEYQSKIGPNTLKCPSCLSHFNPGCKLHYDMYFEGTEALISVCSLPS
ncbi:hypothetical protein QEN19_002329 [Hanseniaspora menglaensis]